MVGTGSRGTSFGGKRVVVNYSNLVTFTKLCDINPERLELAKKYMGVNCPVYTDFEKMMAETKPDLVMVTTVDSNHNEFIIRSMELGVDVLTEKPITTDEVKLSFLLGHYQRQARNGTVCAK